MGVREVPLHGSIAKLSFLPARLVARMVRGAGLGEEVCDIPRRSLWPRHSLFLEEPGADDDGLGRGQHAKVTESQLLLQVTEELVGLKGRKGAQFDGIAQSVDLGHISWHSRSTMVRGNGHEQA